MGLIGAREREELFQLSLRRRRMKEKPPKKLECYHGGSLTSRGSKREGAMVRTVVAAYLDVLCVLNLLSSDASLLCGADQDTCHVPLPSLLEEISPSPLLVPISLPAAVHISPVGDCRHRGLSDRSQLVVCTSLRRESERKHGGGRERRNRARKHKCC